MFAVAVLRTKPLPCGLISRPYRAKAACTCHHPAACPRASAATPSVGRTCANCWPPASTSTPRSTCSTSKASTTWSPKSPAFGCVRPFRIRCWKKPTPSCWWTCLSPPARGQGLRARARRMGGRALFPLRQPVRPARTGPSRHGRAHQRRGPRLPQRPRH